MVENVNDPKTGRFVKGHPPVGGRPMGALGRLPRTVVEQVTAGFEPPSLNESGVTKFVRDLKDEHPTAAVQLVTKMMPSKIEAEVESTNYPGVQVNVISIPAGWQFFGPNHELYPVEEIAAARELVRKGEPYPPPSRQPPVVPFEPYEPYRSSDSVTTATPQVEPEVAALMERVVKRKPNDDPA